MGTPNISAVLTNELKESIKNDVRNIQNALPFLVNLDSKDKRNMIKMGAGSVSFVEDTLTIAKNHPTILPGNFDVAEFEKDVNLTSALSDIASVIIPLAEGISDTLTAVGSEAMKEANIVYAQVKLSSKNDANMDELKTKLAKRYKGQGAKKPVENKSK